MSTTEWLGKQLTYAKQKAELWNGFSDAIATAFSWRLNTIDQTLQDNRSYLTMSDNELDIEQRELGSFFSVANVERDKGLALVHRLDQIHLKETDFAIKDMIERSFDDINIRWSNLYAPVDTTTHPYCSVLLPDDEYNQLSQAEKDTYFLTSRGRIIMSLNTFMPEPEVLDEIYDVIETRIVPLVPLTVVFDGFFAVVDIAITFDLHVYNSFTNAITDNFNIVRNVDFAFDFTASEVSLHYIKDDVHCIDSDTRTQRRLYVDRDAPLLDEIALDAYALDAPYDMETYFSSYHPVNLGVQLFQNTGWINASATHIVDGVRCNVNRLAASSGFVYKPLSLELGETYFIKLTKDTIQGKAVVSINNGFGGQQALLCDHVDSQGDYTVKFKASSITMYLLLECTATSDASFFDMSLNKIIA